MTKWHEVKLAELATIKYGKNQKDVAIESSNIPIYGTGGIMGYASKALYDKPSVLIGRKGTIDKVRYITKPFWTVDTTFYTIINENKILPRYFYYLLSLVDLSSYNEGTTIPSLRTETLNRLEFMVPPLDVQKKIAGVLGALDDKIELNSKINNNLEQQAQALFKSWFVDFEPFGGKMPDDWKVGKLGDFIEIKRGGSPRPIQEYLVPNGLNWLKISDATTETSPYILEIKEHIKPEGLNKTVFLKKGSLVLSNSATPGIPKFLDIDTCIHDGWLYFPNSLFSNEYLFLLFNHIRKDLISLGNGSVFTNLKTDILKNFEAILPTKEVLRRFDSIISSIFISIKYNREEIATLTTLRDMLLPKLMSGEIDVSNVDISALTSADKSSFSGE